MAVEKKSGGCHCGKVRYEVAIDLSDTAIECNCSHCQIKGLLLMFVPAEDFTLLEGEEHLTTYKFNKEHIAHRFCTTCGVQSFSEGKGPNGPLVGINVRSIDAVDLGNIERKAFDGRSY